MGRGRPKGHMGFSKATEEMSVRGCIRSPCSLASTLLLTQPSGINLAQRFPERKPEGRAHLTVGFLEAACLFGDENLMTLCFALATVNHGTNLVISEVQSSIS